MDIEKADKCKENAADDLGNDMLYEPLQEVSSAEDIDDGKVDRFVQKLGICEKWPCGSAGYKQKKPKITSNGDDQKIEILSELIHYVRNLGGYRLFSNERALKKSISMVASNIFRPFLRTWKWYEEAEEKLEDDRSVDWIKLQAVYAFLYEMVNCDDISHEKSMIAGAIDKNFCLGLIQTFQSEDKRERKYVKLILHAIYTKFTPLRLFIRRQIGYVFQASVFESAGHPGIADMLEILSGIVIGFDIPLKDKHTQYFKDFLLPLHRQHALPVYHGKLVECIVEYVRKDFSLASIVVEALLRYWPWNESHKQILFVQEFNLVLEQVPNAYLEEIFPRVLKFISRCLASQHFQVSELSLQISDNEELLTYLMSSEKVRTLFPNIYMLIRTKTCHWNPLVRHLANTTICRCREANESLIEELDKKFSDDLQVKKGIKNRQIRWAEIEMYRPLISSEFSCSLSLQS